MAQAHGAGLAQGTVDSRQAKAPLPAYLGAGLGLGGSPSSMGHTRRVMVKAWLELQDGHLGPGLWRRLTAA